MVIGSSSIFYNLRQASRPASRSLQSSSWYFFCSLLFFTTSWAAPSSSAALEPRQDDTEARPTPPVAYTDPAYLPAQIGGIVGSYAVSLVLVAALLLLLSKRRRDHLTAGENEVEFLANIDKPQYVVDPQPEPDYPAEWVAQEQEVPSSPRSIPRSPVVLGAHRDYSHSHSPASSFHPANAWAPTSAETAADRAPYVVPASPTSTARSPLGIDESVDQTVVAQDREMAQSQLEEMYKYAFEHEEAKKRGLQAPPIPISTGPRSSSGTSRPSTAGAPGSSTPRKMKPAALNLAPEPQEKHKSRTSSLFSALRSPKKKPQAVSISSPIMTPMSGTFPRESQEMNTIPPRQYAPAAPPPVPTDQAPYRGGKPGQVVPLTPEYSPDSSQSIDERLGGAFGPPRNNPANHSRNTSTAPTEPDTAYSETSQTPLVGLPSSPKPGVNRFPSLPASPKPGQQTFNFPASPKPGSSFSRANAPSAVRTGGALPLRAYEPALASPSASSQQIKQTVFDRMAPLSPRGAMTPYTGTAVPYSPYQPFSPCVPVTPSLVTKADRKRMKRLEPKTPTVEMVRSADDIW